MLSYIMRASAHARLRSARSLSLSLSLSHTHTHTTRHRHYEHERRTKLIHTYVVHLGEGGENKALVQKEEIEPGIRSQNSRGENWDILYKDVRQEIQGKRAAKEFQFTRDLMKEKRKMGREGKMKLKK